MSENPQLDQLRAARTKLELALALSALERAPERVPLDPLIVRLAADERWLVRHAAIGALRNALGDVEPILLGLARTSRDAQDLVYINAALSRVGGQASLEYLTGMTFHPKEDVATSALAALTRIGSGAQQPCFLAALSDPRSAVKWYAMIAIETHGDESAIDAVMSRATRILNGKRGVSQLPRSELGAALQFLWRYRARRTDVATFFDVFVPRRAQKLTDAERALLRG